MARDIRIAAERAAALARQTLKFVRREPTRLEAVSMSAVVTELRTLIERVAGSGVEVRSRSRRAQAPRCSIASDWSTSS